MANITGEICTLNVKAQSSKSKNGYVNIYFQTHISIILR